MQSSAARPDPLQGLPTKSSKGCVMVVPGGDWRSGGKEGEANGGCAVRLPRHRLAAAAVGLIYLAEELRFKWNTLLETIACALLVGPEYRARATLSSESCSINYVRPHRHMSDDQSDEQKAYEARLQRRLGIWTSPASIDTC